MDSLDRKNIMNMLMSRAGANGGGIYERNKRNRQWGGNQFTITPTESVSITNSPLDPERTKRMMLDRMYGNNDAQSPYYKGRWMAPGNPGANLAERAKALARGTGGSFGGGLNALPNAVPANAPMAPPMTTGSPLGDYENPMLRKKKKPWFGGE